MATFLALLLLTCAFGATILAVQDPCANLGNPLPNAPPLPSLPTTAFKSHIRAIILNKNMIVEGEEYVDESYNAAAMNIIQNGQTIKMILHYNSNEIYYIFQNPTNNGPPTICAAANLSAVSNAQLSGEQIDPTTGVPHLFSTAMILNFANNSNQRYLGQTTVDGVAVNHWASCGYWSQLNANFSINYYFTVPGWQTPSGLPQVPVQMQVVGIRTYSNGTVTNYNHTYQYVDFEPYVKDPRGVFETPPGIYCMLRKPTKTVPIPKHQFYYREELNDPMGRTQTEFDIWYDFDMQLDRTDSRMQPAGTSLQFTSNGPFSVIHDYGTGVQYAIDKSTSLCSVDPIPISSQGFDAVLNITRNTLRMRNPTEFFNLDGSYVYVGKRTARSMLCDVYQTMTSKIPGRGLVLYETYFLSGVQTITDVGSDRDTTLPYPVRFLEWEDGNMISEYDIHNFDQDSPQSNAFDITPCFTGVKSVNFEMTLTTDNTQLIIPLQNYITNMLSITVSRAVPMSPIRVQNTRIHWNERSVYFQGTILDRPPPLAKFQQAFGRKMRVTDGKSAGSMNTAGDCANACDGLQEWTCTSFDYCPGTKVCVLGRAETNSETLNLTQIADCSHYTRVLGGAYDAQPTLLVAWDRIKNAVYQNLVALDLPIPNADGTINADMMLNPDPNNKFTLRATAITDQVIGATGRNPTTALAIKQFLIIPGRMGKGSDTRINGVSVDDCAKECVNEMTYNCQSFAYCWSAGTCFLSRNHPDQRPDLLKDSTACDLYYRDYSSNFQAFNGVTVLSASDTIYQNIININMCAKLCMNYNSFHCESFDFCPSISTCFLGRTHYYSVPKANIQQTPSCSHYSRNYLDDFLSRAHTTVQLSNSRVVSGITPEQCAQMCVVEASFNCNSFNYCVNQTECSITDAAVSNVGQTTVQASATCDVYQRQYRPSGSGTGTGATSRSVGSNAGSSSGKYSSGSMAGIAIGMLAVGIILGWAALMLFTRYFSRGGDGMQISFTKQIHDTE